MKELKWQHSPKPQLVLTVKLYLLEKTELKAVSCRNSVLFLYLTLFFVAFPVSGMVTIPVSMYQTVVTNIQNLTDAGMPVTMSALTGQPEPIEQTEEQVNDATTTTAGEEVKTVLNGTQTAMEEES